MPTRDAHARWQGGIKAGNGHLETGSRAVNTAYSFGSRFDTEAGANPEELLGAAEAGCLAMAVAKALGDEGYSPEVIHVDAQVRLGESDGAPAITGVDLTLRGQAEGLRDSDLGRIANEAVKTCPVSRALAGVEINLRLAETATA